MGAAEARVLAFLEIVRASFVSLGRRLGPWLLGISVACAVALAWRPELRAGAEWTYDIGLGGAAVLAIVGVLLPVFVGRGVGRWMTGPLGLDGSTPRYVATVAYGLGGALVATPFVWSCLTFADWPHPRIDDAILALPTTFIAAWIGAAAGRIFSNPIAVLLGSWMGWAVVIGVTWALGWAFGVRGAAGLPLVLAYLLGTTQALVLIACSIGARASAVKA